MVGIKDHKFRVTKFFFRGYLTNQWGVQVFRTWNDSKGYSGSAWRGISPSTFDTKEKAQKWLDNNKEIKQCLID